MREMVFGSKFLNLSPNPPTTLAATPLVGQTYIRPLKISWAIHLCKQTHALHFGWLCVFSQSKRIRYSRLNKGMLHLNKLKRRAGNFFVDSLSCSSLLMTRKWAILLSHTCDVIISFGFAKTLKINEPAISHVWRRTTQSNREDKLWM